MKLKERQKNHFWLYLVIICLLVFQINISFALSNPSAIYCEKLGYEYEIIDTPKGQEGLCVISTNTKFKAWDFLKGKIGQEYSYCAKNGYDIKIMAGNSSFTSEYAVCLVPESSSKLFSNIFLKKEKKEIPVLELMKQNNENLFKETKYFFEKNKLKIRSKFYNKETSKISNSLRGDYPSSLDWRTKDGKDWTTPIRDQGDCGSCWAFSATGVVESRVNIALNNSTYNIDLSEQDLVSCSDAGDCSGGWESGALEYIKTNGTVKESCFLYSATDESCSNKCDNWDNELIKVLNYTVIQSSVSSIKQTINDYGPVTVYMEVYDDFYVYTNGIYDTIYFANSSHYEGLHAISIVGYDDDNSYWICKNSWDIIWGESGYFKISYNAQTFNFNPIYFTDGYFFLDESYVVTQTDIDNDGIPDDSDNCPETLNSNQSDMDSDGIGDVCDSDMDGDGILNGNDECNITWGTLYNGCPDIYSPNLTINSPKPNSFLDSKLIQINLSVSDPSYNKTNISIYKCDVLINSTTSTKNETFLVNLSVQEEGIYKIIATAYDNFNNENTTTVDNLTIDTTNPQITINSPISNSLINSTSIIIDLTTTDTNMNYTNISITNSTSSVVNSTTNPTNGSYFTILSVPAEGVYNIIATTYDKADNFNITTNINITIDITNPQINFTYPTTETGIYSQNYIETNVTVSDTNLANVTIYLYNSTGLLYNFTNSTGFFYNFTNLDDGTYYLNATANDTAGNTNNTETITIVLDTSSAIALNETISDNNIYINRNWSYQEAYSDENLNGSKLEWNGTNETATVSGMRCYLNKTGLADGNHTYKFWVNDSTGNWNSTSEYWVYVDITNPKINFINPTTETGDHSQNYIEANVTASDKNLENATIYLYNSIGLLYNFTNSTGFFYNFTNLNDGTYYLNATANDTAGNTNNTETITITLDTTSSAIALNETISDNNIYINRNWSYQEAYSTESLNGSGMEWNGTNETAIVSGTRCYLNKTNLTDGNYTYKFWVNDSAGNWNSTNLYWVYVDTANPQITNISTATSGTSTVTITLSVTTDENAVCRYTIISNETNYSSMNTFNLSGTTNHSETFIYYSDSSGTYYVRCKDTAGNVMNSSNSATYNADVIVGSGSTSSRSSSGGIYIPSYWITTYTVTDKNFTAGYSRELKEKRRLKIKVDDENHYVGIVNLTNTTVTINISSTPQQATFLVGDEKKFEVTNDSYYDIYVKLNSITNDLANLTIKKIHELILTEPEEEIEVENQTVEQEETVPQVICNQGEKRCLGKFLQECKSNEWMAIQTCEYGCNSGDLICNPVSSQESEEKPDYSGILIVVLIIIVFGWIGLLF
ncbi:MAG: thrombospondin type 3 repeat-containing protein [Candidatus Aenigmarchaeota archaeon]|nr:thrombospondin type 3 repeat-containing protein [Candidatus Aenigmarchaeota archaeon]